MEIVDQNGVILESENGTPIIDPNLERGHLVDSSRIVHHDAVQGVDEVFHYETVAEYPNGGRDVRKVIDVPGVEAAEAYDEEIPYQVYVLYTEEELAERNQPTELERLQERIYELESNNEMLMECVLEMSELLYA